jgi:Ni,Fe-hydrogenase III small subunit
MAEPLRRTYEAMPDPRVVIAVGTDAVSGGLLGGGDIGGAAAGPAYATSGGIGTILPVDVWVPGSPPPPFGVLQGLLLAIGRLRDGAKR